MCAKNTRAGFASRARSYGEDETCPCGTGEVYRRCCARWHEGAEHLRAPTAEALMRSRYSAFVKENAPYLLDTWHASTRPTSLDFEPGLKWLGLEVKSHTSHENEAEVAFVARARQKDGRAFRQQEHSRFVKENGQWFYVA
ncbi:MAG: SEC-C domain-containing protein [Pigmentiphaga sp.]|nr:SEC-C domain-containing protein [Pigmentiphaga sp.]